MTCRSNVALSIAATLLRQPCTARQLHDLLIGAHGESPSVRQIRRIINSAAMSGFRVMIVGHEPSRTGKGRMFNVYKMEVA